MMKCIATLESDYSKCKNKRRCRDELQKMEKEHMIFFVFWPGTVLFLNLGVVTEYFTVLPCNVQVWTTRLGVGRAVESLTY